MKVSLYAGMVITLLSLCFVLGCSEKDIVGPGQIKSSAHLGAEKAHPPNWEIGNYWVIKRTEKVEDHDGNVYKDDERMLVIVVENATHLNATIPYTAKEGDLNVRSLYLRRATTFDELESRGPEGDNWVDEDVYVVKRYEPTKLKPVYDETGTCGEPRYYQLDFTSEKHEKEIAYSQKDLSLVWDPDMPGRRMKMFHWPLRTGKYWSFTIINTNSSEGQKFLREKLEWARKEGYDFDENDVLGKGTITDYTDGRFNIEMFSLYPFFANYDKKEQTFIYDTNNSYWDWRVHSDLAGVVSDLSEIVVISGHTNNTEELFQELTGVIDHRVENPNHEELCKSQAEDLNI